MSEVLATGPILAGVHRVSEQQQTFSRRMKIFAPLALIAFVAAACQVHPAPGLSGRGLAVSIAVAGFVVGVIATNLLLESSSGWQVVLAVLVAASCVLLMALQPAGPGAEGALVAVLFGGRLLPGRPVFPALAVACAGLAVFAGLAGQGLGGASTVAALAALYGLMVLAFRLGEANRQAGALVLELERSRDAEARAAGLAERQRLAREMHDVLAHSLSGLTLQLEAARMLTVDAPDDPRLPAVIERAYQLGKRGLDEARRAIGTLRDEELPGPERLKQLAADFEHDSGIPCRLDVTGVQHALASQARLAVYRVAQEALTNVAKHADPVRVEVQLAYEPQGVQLRVEDFGAAAQPNAAANGDAGYGLTGMRERAELLGGSLHAGPTETGFRVTLCVPA